MKGFCEVQFVRQGLLALVLMGLLVGIPVVDRVAWSLYSGMRQKSTPVSVLLVCAAGTALALYGCTGSSGGKSGSGAGTDASSPIVSDAAPTILWHDDIQGTSELMGFSGFGIEHPIGTEVTGSDQNGANLSRVANPLPGDGFALRHLGVFDLGGARAQAGLYGDATPAFGNQATRPEGIWVAAEIYFPEVLIAPSGGGWLSIWDWHSIDAGTRGNRWHTDPGLMIASDGSMRLQLAWGQGTMHDINGDGPTSTVEMPVGRWFDLEMHFEWVDTQRGTIQVWLDGELMLEQRNVQTRASSHAVVETYMKWYGSTFTDGAWQPSPGIRYTRNVRVAGERIWR